MRFGGGRGWGTGAAVAAISVPHPADDRTVVAPLADDLSRDGEVIYLPSPFLDVDDHEPSTSGLALGTFGLGLAISVALAVAAPFLAASALVAGIVGGGILNAPAGPERWRTVAALGLPTVGLLVVTVLFLSWV
jgi:hypothetical protein